MKLSLSSRKLSRIGESDRRPSCRACPEGYWQRKPREGRGGERLLELLRSDRQNGERKVGGGMGVGWAWTDFLTDQELDDLGKLHQDLEVWRWIGRPP